MALISQEYQKLNERFHVEREDYGTSGRHYADRVMTLAAKLSETGPATILDYGCGKATLCESLPQFRVHNYDPCIPEYAARPESAYDLVVCTDVMEHVEPASTVEVLADIASYAARAIFFQIATRPAKKELPDGRNAHINLAENIEWFYAMADPEGPMRDFSINLYERIPTQDGEDAGLFLVLQRKP